MRPGSHLVHPTRQQMLPKCVLAHISRSRSADKRRRMCTRIHRRMTNVSPYGRRIVTEEEQTVTEQTVTEQGDRYGQSRTVDLDGPVHYVDFGGPDDGSTVVLVHGLRGSDLHSGLVRAVRPHHLPCLA